jgi:hypothetical protein
MNNPQNSTPLPDFLDGVESQVTGGGEWLPAIIQSDGEIQHQGEEITEEELARRWEEHGRGDLQAIDFRPPE